MFQIMLHITFYCTLLFQYFQLNLIYTDFNLCWISDIGFIPWFLNQEFLKIKFFSLISRGNFSTTISGSKLPRQPLHFYFFDRNTKINTSNSWIWLVTGNFHVVLSTNVVRFPLVRNAFNLLCFFSMIYLFQYRSSCHYS